MDNAVRSFAAALSNDGLHLSSPSRNAGLGECFGEMDDQLTGIIGGRR